jgi:ferrous iron transport protein B
MKRVLLFGNPNVGKSALFNRLTGANVIVSNYPGTTVDFTKGILSIGDSRITVEDAPGTYSLEPTSVAEEVAVNMLNSLDKDDVVVLVIDSTTLERGLYLALQVLKRRLPSVIALNMADEARHIGVKINIEKLQEILGVPCVPTVAITRVGISELVSALPKAKISTIEFDDSHIWDKVGDITKQVQDITHRHHTVLERLGDATVKPLTGIPFAIIIILFSFIAIHYPAEGLISLIEPLFEKYWASLMLSLSERLGNKGVLHNLLIGEVTKEDLGKLIEENGERFILVGETKRKIDDVTQEALKERAGNFTVEGERLFVKRIAYKESFGVLTTGLYVELCAILPYILAFFLVLSLLEDTGYLPRLAVLIDTLMHRVGLHGMGIVPMILGLGCNVPGMLSLRILESRRERFIAATLLAIGVPCMAQTAMVFGLAGKFGLRALVPIFFSLFIVWITLGVLMNKFMRGESPEILLDVPPYRPPYPNILLKKLWTRTLWFLKGGVIWVLGGIMLANILYTLGVIEFIGNITAPLIVGLLGLPKDSVAAIILGLLRKDVAVGMLLPLEMNITQTIVACVVLTMFFPCIASFVMMLKELGIKDTIKSALIMLVSAFAVGTLLHRILVLAESVFAR